MCEERQHVLRMARGAARTTPRQRPRNDVFLCSYKRFVLTNENCRMEYIYGELSISDINPTFFKERIVNEVNTANVWYKFNGIANPNKYQGMLQRLPITRDLSPS